MGLSSPFPVPAPICNSPSQYTEGPAGVSSACTYTAPQHTNTSFPSAMGAYLWLVWYNAASKLLPKHWTLAVTYEACDRAYATVYEVSNELSGFYQSRVIRRVHLTSNHPSGAYGGRILLGEVNDNALCSLEAYSDTAAELVNSQNRKRGQNSSNCHDWALIIVRSLEDALLLPQGALARLEKCPRVG
ncbi:hypothetical protein C8Q77DRAFT_44576 [Trametes polyzona]|nr:hypothetical protein C8Q77DRAFT_44576 [Trametes polyzona]